MVEISTERTSQPTISDLLRESRIQAGVAPKNPGLEMVVSSVISAKGVDWIKKFLGDLGRVLGKNTDAQAQVRRNLEELEQALSELREMVTEGLLGEELDLSNLTPEQRVRLVEKLRENSLTLTPESKRGILAALITSPYLDEESRGKIEQALHEGQPDRAFEELDEKLLELFLNDPDFLVHLARDLFAKGVLDQVFQVRLSAALHRCEGLDAELRELVAGRFKEHITTQATRSDDGDGHAFIKSQESSARSGSQKIELLLSQEGPEWEKRRYDEFLRKLSDEIKEVLESVGDARRREHQREVEEEAQYEAFMAEKVREIILDIIQEFPELRDTILAVVSAQVHFVDSPPMAGKIAALRAEGKRLRDSCAE